MKNCEYYQMLISAFIDEELDYTTRTEVIAHISECAACRETFQFYRELHFASERLAELPPAGFSRDVMSKVKKIKRNRLMQRVVPYSLGAVAAVFVLVAVFRSYAPAPSEEGLNDDTYLQNNVVASASRPDEKAPEARVTIEAAQSFDAVIIDEDKDATGPEPVQEKTQITDTGGATNTPAPAPATVTAPPELDPVIMEPEVAYEGEAIEETPDAELPPITMMSADAPMEATGVRMFAFSMPTVLPAWTEDGHLDLASSGEISYIVITEGDDSHAEQTPEGIGAITEQFLQYALTLTDAREPEETNVIRYMLYFSDGSMLNISLYTESRYIDCDGTWYTIDNADDLPQPIVPPEDDDTDPDDIIEATKPEDGVVVFPEPTDETVSVSAEPPVVEG